MTTSVKLRTNGNYVSELKNAGGTVLGHAGPGSNVESDWIGFPHGEAATITERSATPEEIEAAKPVAPAGKPLDLTEGGYRVGVTFNPSNNEAVDHIKAAAANLIDYLAPIANNRDHPGARCASIAMTEIESAAMWAVKAVTKQPR